MRNLCPIKYLPVVVLMTLTSPCYAEESDDMRLGEADYRNHDYNEAVGHLGAALPTEFNNANLHYHLANCMVHLHQKEAAIREYRIAYALQPTGKVGRYSKQCLHLFGIDAEGKMVSKAASKEKDKHPEEPALKQESGLLNVYKFVSDDDYKTAQNLEVLLNEKAHPGSAKLQKVGTSLFVRNYKDPLERKDSQLAKLEPPKDQFTKTPQPAKNPWQAFNPFSLLSPKEPIKSTRVPMTESKSSKQSAVNKNASN